MPSGRLSKIRRFENRAQNFSHLVKRGKVPPHPLNESLLTGRKGTKGLIKKVKPNDFRRTVSAQTKIQRVIKRKEPEHITFVFPAHSKRGMVQEHFNVPTIHALQLYFAGYRLPRNYLLLCKQLLHRKGNEGLTAMKLAEAMSELARITVSAKVDMGDNIQDNGVVLGMDQRTGRVRIAVIDA